MGLVVDLMMTTELQGFTIALTLLTKICVLSAATIFVRLICSLRA